MNDVNFQHFRCRVIEPDEARTAGHQHVLLVMAQTFDVDGATVLCEPSIVGQRSGVPDLVVVDPYSGVHVIEVKGVTLDAVRSVQPGGAIEIEYDSGRRRDPVKQARNAMFDIRDVASRHFGGDLNAVFEHWVVFPQIKRDEWEAKFGELIAGRREVLFRDDLESSGLVGRLRERATSRLGGGDANGGTLLVPPKQMDSLMAAFGDSAVLAPVDPAPPVAASEGSLGEHLADRHGEYRALTEQQQRLASQDWNEGPRLVRGVAGSGKTVVLAAQMARMLARRHGETRSLFEREGERPVRILAVCFNRTLVPFIRERIEAAWGQRRDEPLPAESLEVVHFNGLMWQLSEEGFVRYQRIADRRSAGDRARSYLSDLTHDPDRLRERGYDAVFVDEGQDFHEDEYRILLHLCGRSANGHPRMFVFYDDAQNLYGHTRPTWKDLGLEVRGRSVVMDRAFRNTRQIIEPAFNVLVGSHAADPDRVGTRGFADLQTLVEKKLVREGDAGRHVRVDFATREGDTVMFRRHVRAADETASIVDRVKVLLDVEALRAHEVLILVRRRERAEEVKRALAASVGGGRVRFAAADGNKDQPAIQTGVLTVSTVASAKGYDAPYVLLASAHEFAGDIEGRASFYVGCTRAREWLEVHAAGESAVTREFERALDGVGGG